MSLIPALELSVDGASIVHKADPRAKLVGLAAFVVAASVLPSGAAAGYALLLLLLGVAVAATRLPAVVVLRRATPPLLVAVSLALSALFQARGEEYFSARVLWMRLAVGPYGVARFVDVLTRTILCSLAIGLHASATPFPDTVLALRSLGVPEVFTSVLAMTYRYLSVLLDEGQRMQRARDSRTLREPSLRRLCDQARLFGAMVGSLFLRAYGRSERVYQAMLARGYRGNTLLLASLRWRRQDSAALAAWVLALAAVVALSLLRRAP